MQYINDMLNEGYRLKEVSIGGNRYNYTMIKNINIFSNHIAFELLINEIIFAPLNKIDYIKIEEESGQ